MQSTTGSGSIFIGSGLPELKYDIAPTPDKASLYFPTDIKCAREQLEHLKAEFERISSKDANDGTYTILDSDGKVHTEMLPPLSSGRRYKIEYKPTFKRLLKFDHDIYKCGPFAGPKVRSIAYIGVGASTPSNPDERKNDEPKNWPALLNKLDDHEPDEKWEKSTTANAITDFLKTHGKHMKTVTKVVGLGLGNPGERLLADVQDNAYFQHLTLCHIAREISKAQDNQKIRVLVQDPNYTALSKSLLEDLSDLNENFPIEIALDPEGFLEMDDQTIMFHCHLPFDVADIALEVAGDNGLAGLIGAEIGADHQKELEGKVLHKDTTMFQLGKLNSSKKCNWAKSCKKIALERSEGWYGQGAHFYVRSSK